jgi:hypothetical protein
VDDAFDLFGAHLEVGQRRQSLTRLLEGGGGTDAGIGDLGQDGSAGLAPVKPQTA